MNILSIVKSIFIVLYTLFFFHFFIAMVNEFVLDISGDSQLSDVPGENLCVSVVNAQTIMAIRRSHICM